MIKKKDTNPETHMITSRLMKGGELLKGKISQHEILMILGKFELSISACCSIIQWQHFLLPPTGIYVCMITQTGSIIYLPRLQY